LSQDALMGIVAVFVPLLATLVKQAGWSSTINALVALAVYAIVGVIAALIAGPITLDTLVTSIGIFSVVGTSAYNLFWKNMGEATLNLATSFVKPMATPETPDATAV
jgi:hypothetical protein